MQTTPNLFGQIRTTSLWLISIVFWTVIIVIALNIFAPPWASKLNIFLEEHITQWDEESCLESPYECLQHKERESIKVGLEIDNAISSLKSALKNLQNYQKEHAQLLVANQLLLAEGKKMLTQYTDNTTDEVSIWFSGSHFSSRTAFHQQINLLNQEKDSLKKQQQSSLKVSKDLQQKIDQLLLKKGAINLQKQTIPSQLALLKANMVLSDFDDRVLNINNLLESSQLELEGSTNLIRTTRDLIKQAPSTEAKG